jgi:hypothetical protein
MSTPITYRIKYDRTDGSLNGAVDLGNSPYHITMAKNNDGLLEIFFAGTDRNLYHIRQVAGSTWEGLGSFSGSTAQQVAAASGPAGFLYLLFIGTDNHLYITEQTNFSQNTWSAKQILDGATAKSVTIGQNANGYLDVFYIGTNNNLYHNYQTGPRGWSGELHLAGAQAKQVAAASNADGRIEVFYVGTNNDLYHVAQTVANDSFTWTAEQRLSGASANQVAAARNQDGRLQVVYFGTNSDIYSNSQLGPNSTIWAGETLVSGGIGAPNQPSPTQQIALGAKQDGTLQLFYVAASTALHYNVQSGPNGTWAGESRIEAQDYVNEVTITKNANGSLALAYIAQVVNSVPGK